MTRDHREVEEKYDVDESTPLPVLSGLPGVASVDAPVAVDLEATYYDTGELALTRAGITLRRRTGGADAGWHLKLPSEDARQEIRVPLSRAKTVAPQPLRRIVQGHVRGQPMAPVTTLRTRRTIHALRDQDGRVLAEVADDRVTAERPATADRAAGTSAWREWEVELVDGDRSLLRAARDVLRAADATPSAWPSKLARALGDRIPQQRSGPPPAPRLKGPAAAVVQARLAEQVAELRLRDPLVRHDATEAVHKMRAATRRLRGALATFRPLLDGDAADALRDELRWLTTSLGPARDTEVIRDRLQHMVAAERPELVRGGIRRRIDLELGGQYRTAHAGALQVLDSARYFALLDRLDALAAHPPFSAAAAEPARDVLPRLVRRDWKRLERRVAAVEATHDPAEVDLRLHDVRKAAKRIRYAAEPLTPLYGADAERFVRAVKTLLSVLGDHQDGIVTRAALRSLADRAAAHGENAFTYGLLYAREEAAGAATAGAFGEAWRVASRKRLRRWLAG
ncbi:MAG: CYTH and CHAD domain-containing protein [Nocardioidaceae bacterium]